MNDRSFDYCPTLAELVHTNSTVGRSGRIFDQLPALSTVGNLQILKQLMEENDCQRTLEVGLCYGGSALMFTSVHQLLGHPQIQQHTAMDPFQMKDWDAAGLVNIEKAGLSGFLDFQHAYSALHLPQLLGEIKSGARQGYNLIYIDGSHIFEDVFVDAYYSIQLLAEQGIVCFDDSPDPHVAKVIHFLRRTMKDSLSELDLGRYRSNEPALKRLARNFLNRSQLTAFRRIGTTNRAWNAPFVKF